MSVRGPMICLAVTLAACTSPPETMPGAPAAALARADAPIPSGSLCVANANSIAIYAPGSTSPIRTISHLQPVSMAFDRGGDLYVGIFSRVRGGVVEYHRGTIAVVQTIKHQVRDPRALAFDGSDNLYIANFKASPGDVTIYSPSGAFVGVIRAGISHPGELVFDSQGNLYAGNVSSDITVYAPGQTTVSRTIYQGIGGPLALAIDADNNLYSVNNFNVTVYAPGSLKVLRTLSDGIVLPSTLAFDRAGNVYVANWGPNPSQSSVTVYRHASRRPRRAIRDGISDPDALVFDHKGNLYVANYATNTIAIYAPDTLRLLRTIRTGIVRPLKLAISP